MRSCENCIFLLESKIHKIKNIEYLLIGCLQNGDSYWINNIQMQEKSLHNSHYDE